MCAMLHSRECCIVVLNAGGAAKNRPVVPFPTPAARFGKSACQYKNVLNVTYLKLISIPDRPQHGGHAHTEFTLNLVQQLERAERGSVHLVDEREDGEFPQLADLTKRTATRHKVIKSCADNRRPR